MDSMAELTLIAISEQVQAMEDRFSAQIQRQHKQLSELGVSRVMDRLQELEEFQKLSNQRLAEVIGGYKEKFGAQIAKLQQPIDCLLGMPCVLERVSQLESAHSTSDAKILADKLQAQMSHTDQIDRQFASWQKEITATVQELDLQCQKMNSAQDIAFASVDDQHKQVAQQMGRLEEALQDIGSQPAAPASQSSSMAGALTSVERQVTDIQRKVEHLLKCFPEVQARVDDQEEDLRRLRLQAGQSVERIIFDKKLLEIKRSIRELGQEDQLQETVRTFAKRSDRQDADISDLNKRLQASEVAARSTDSQVARLLEQNTDFRLMLSRREAPQMESKLVPRGDNGAKRELPTGSSAARTNMGKVDGLSVATSSTAKADSEQLGRNGSCRDDESPHRGTGALDAFKSRRAERMHHNVAVGTEPKYEQKHGSSQAIDEGRSHGHSCSTPRRRFQSSPPCSTRGRRFEGEQLTTERVEGSGDEDGRVTPRDRALWRLKELRRAEFQQELGDAGCMDDTRRPHSLGNLGTDVAAQVNRIEASSGQPSRNLR